MSLMEANSPTNPWRRSPALLITSTSPGRAIFVASPMAAVTSGVVWTVSAGPTSLTGRQMGRISGPMPDSSAWPRFVGATWR